MARRRIGRDAPPAPPPGPPEVPIPHDLVNEQVILAVACADATSRSWLVKRVRTDSMFGKGHPEAWAAVAELERQGLEYSSATIRQVSGGKVDGAHLDRLVATYAAGARNVRHHVEMLEWDRARIIAANGPVSKFIQMLGDVQTQPDALRAAARAVGTSFDGHGAHRLLHDPNELVRSQAAEIENLQKGQARFTYGIDGLDDDEDGNPRVIPGAAPGQMTVICGVPGSSKSTFTARIVLGQVEQGRRVLYGAWEMKAGVTLQVLAAMRLGMSRTRLQCGDLTEEERALHRDQMEVISGYVRFMKLPGRERGVKVSNDQVLDTIEAYISDTACDVAAFDLWKRCLRYTDPDDEEQALYRQQAMLQETNVHGILVQQLRGKDVETRSNQRPTRESIKGSSAWFEVPDTIFGIYRPALSKRVDDTIAEVDGIKQRWGKFPWAVEFDWDGDKGSFENARSVPYEPPTMEGNDLMDNFKVDAKKSKK